MNFRPKVLKGWYLRLTALNLFHMIHFTFSQQIHNFLIQFTCTWSRFYDVLQLSRGGSRVVTLLCKRRIIAFDPYLNSWKGFKTGLEEMWLLLKASLRTKGWIHLKCIGFLWQRHNFVTVTKILLLLLILYSYYFYIYTSLWKIILYFKKKIKIHDICDSHNKKRYI